MHTRSQRVWNRHRLACTPVLARAGDPPNYARPRCQRRRQTTAPANIIAPPHVYRSLANRRSPAATNPALGYRGADVSDWARRVHHQYDEHAQPPTHERGAISPVNHGSQATKGAGQHQNRHLTRDDTLSASTRSAHSPIVDTDFAQRRGRVALRGNT